MFSDVQENKRMLQGAYRKLKCYYYYNKNFIVIRKKIAEFESEPKTMDKIFDQLAESLCHPNAEKSKKYLDSLIDKIDFFVVPKKFETETLKNNSVISNTIPRDKKMKSVNFFIDAPIEVHILDCLWTIFLAKMDNDKSVISSNAYGNTINKSVLFSGDRINFDNRILFNRYFNKYTEWRNDAFQCIEALYRFRQDSLLISLDIKSFFYSVTFSFKKLSEYFDNHQMLREILALTKYMERVYREYFRIIQSFRSDLVGWKKDQYPLPIGLFSSMVLGNIYLKDFDEKVLQLPEVTYYGRYVDDILIVLNKTVNKKDSASLILQDVFVDSGLFYEDNTNLLIKDYDRLCIQSDKVKLLYIDHTESRAIIDIYNNTIRLEPSQMDPLPDTNIDLSSFDEMAYSIENFTKEKKIRDMGFIGVDAFKVGRFFSALPRTYSQIDVMRKKHEINYHITQIEKFFTGSQSLEFHTNWLNYMYFLVITERKAQLRTFVSTVKKQIAELKATSLDRELYKQRATINKKAKEFLVQYLETGEYIALCLNFSLVEKHFPSKIKEIKKFAHSNMFEHTLVTFPLANYLEYTEKEPSYCKMLLNDMGEYPEKAEESFKFIWSPRFIHYDELLLLLFYDYHNKNKHGKAYQYVQDGLVNKFFQINFLDNVSFEIESEKISENAEYCIRKIIVPPNDSVSSSSVYVAIGSINISFDDCVRACDDRWANITLAQKEMFFNILRETYSCLITKEHTSKNHKTMFLVLPELCFPIYWINDLIRFAKRSQIGIITGLQYLGDDSKRQYNYIATILPFISGKKKYNNAFVYIREKNDYSPIEFVELAKRGFYCKNRELADYQIFKWKGIRLAPFVCYELTDIMARALVKGRCDFVTASVFNPDTTYFSNIIDSASRDLHAFIVQANTSYYGDSRITGPYDRDSKDIFKIKGGTNDHVVIGKIDFYKYKKYQLEYASNFEKELEQIKKSRKKRQSKTLKKERSKPDIKRLSARYKVEDI